MQVWFGLARVMCNVGQVWFGQVWFGQVWFDQVIFGWNWFDQVRFGWAGVGQVRQVTLEKDSKKLKQLQNWDFTLKSVKILAFTATNLQILRP